MLSLRTDTPTMRRPLNRVVFFCLWMLSVAMTAAPAPDLSGTWRLDQDASRFTPPMFSAGRGGGSADSLYITHATNGAQAWVYRIGGESDVLWGQEGSLTVVSRWEDRRLVAEGGRGTEDDTEHIREVFSLSADGRTLTVEVTTTTADRASTNLAVYTKASSVGPCEGWETPCAR